MNEVYAQFFVNDPPARATVQAARLPRDARVEIETLDWLRTSEGERLLVHASRAWADHAGDPVRVASVVRRLEPDAEKAAAATTQA